MVPPMAAPAAVLLLAWLLAGCLVAATHTVHLVFFYGDTVWLGLLEVQVLFPSLLPLLPVKCHRINHSQGPG